ncbi:uncharacterized protein LOC142529048 isoform X4 [Primulina tabacum]|uniref:uncharacterized protein LOC142529048 isoform X4 n=1 Tax=Primulina tabacum TaxID=48773 RepID=UPI003F5A5422
MDPKYSGNNQQDTPRIPHAISPSYYFSTEQAHGAGRMDPEFRRLQHGYIRNNYPHNLHQHHPQDMHEVIRREIEKERIREEIIMSEIVRRRVLEAEVRRELMMEREMAMQRGSDGIPYGSSPVMRLESPMQSSLLGTRAEGWSAEERLGMSLDDKEKQIGRLENGGLDASPFQRTADLRILEVKPASEGNNEKERILLLTRPDENVSGSKRKAVTPPEELPADIIANKKSKEKWSCTLCQVSATSEKALEDHVLGKKHKSKEAALKAHRGGKNYSIGLYSSEATKSNPVVGTIDPGEEEGVKHKAQSLLSEKAGEASSKKDDLPLLENSKSEHLKKTQSEVIRKVKNNEDDPKKKGYKFWCEICQVGTLSGKVMNGHKKGKKHISRLRSCVRNGGTGSVNQKKSATISDCVEEASENGKNVNSEKFNQALDQASSEDHVLLDAIDYREHEGETLNSDDIIKANLDEKRSKGHLFLDAVEQEDHKQVGIIKEETGDVNIAKPEGGSKNDEDEPGDQEQTICSMRSIAKPQV